MHKWSVIGLLLPLAAAACQGQDARGRPCDSSEVCGSGYYCHVGSCVAVCVADADCRSDERCQQHRCMATESPAKQLPHRANPVGGSGAQAAAPDVTALELRAIRKELEIIRRQQQDILKRLESTAASRAEAP